MRRKIKKLWTNEFIRGGFFLTVSSMIVNILNYFFHFITGRLLGPSGYGEITTLFSYIIITIVPISVISTFLTQKISATEGDQLNLVYSLELFFWTLIKKRWVMAAPIILIIPFLPQLTNLSPPMAYLLIPLIAVAFISSFYGAAFQGLRLFTIVALINLLAACLKLIGAISLIAFNQLTVIALFLLFSGLIPLFLSYYLLSERIKKTITTQPAVINKKLIHIITSPQFIITFFSVLSITILSNFDIVFVKKIFTPVESGIYNSWSLFAKIILYIVGPLVSISFIFFSSSKHKQSQDQILKISLGLLALVGIVSFIGYITFAKTLINLFFGRKFVAVIPYLGQASIFGMLYTLITFTNTYFLAKKSNFSLILTFFLPLYILFLFLIPRQLIAVMNLNIVFSLVVTLSYLTAYFYSTRSKYNIV